MLVAGVEEVLRSDLVDRHCCGSLREVHLEGGIDMRLALRPCLEVERLVVEQRIGLGLVDLADRVEIAGEHSKFDGSYGTVVLGMPFCRKSR